MNVIDIRNKPLPKSDLDVELERKQSTQKFIDCWIMMNDAERVFINQYLDNILQLKEQVYAYR